LQIKAIPVDLDLTTIHNLRRKVFILLVFWEL